jgi:phospholipase/carboxylesterase
MVLCHGFGAPGTDLVPLGDVLADRVGEEGERVQFVFPAAPLSLDSQGIPGGRAWWPIDMLQLQMAMATGEFRELRSEAPELLPEMSGLLMQLVDELCERTGLPKTRVILGGFSQGAMLSTDAALRMPTRPGGLVVWSGTLLNEAAWTEAASQGSGLQVVQSHAVDDPILPYSGAEALRNLLTDKGHSVEFLKFRGGHSIPEPAIGMAARLIGTVLSSP